MHSPLVEGSRVDVNSTAEAPLVTLRFAINVPISPLCHRVDINKPNALPHWQPLLYDRLVAITAESPILTLGV
jgi:hypothetical protein